MKKPAAPKKSYTTKIMAAAAVLGISCASLVAYKAILSSTSYTVTRIIDGDTFETKEKQIVRIDGIQAPEKGLCGFKEATQTLTDIVLNKKVYIKTVYLDAYRRMVARVYLSDGTDLAYTLAKKGAVYVNQKSKSDHILLGLGEEARMANRGIFGYPCTQMENKEHPNCQIKGNKASGKGTGIYHRPDCRQHDIVKVQLYLGDQWFCSEREARAAGFVPSKDCP